MDASDKTSRTLRVSIAVLLLLTGLAMAAGTFYVLASTPPHQDAGWGVGFALIAVAIIALEVGSVGVGAWVLWRWKFKMTSQLVGITCIVSVVMSFKLVSAANVVFDDSEPVRHAVQFVAFVSNSGFKQPSYVVVTSWREPGTNAALELPLSSHHFVPGKQLVVTTHAGFLGREYAIDLEPAGR